MGTIFLDPCQYPCKSAKAENDKNISKIYIHRNLNKKCISKLPIDLYLKIGKFEKKSRFPIIPEKMTFVKISERIS